MKFVKFVAKNRLELVSVNSTNVGQAGFFCYKSKPKTEGYRQKLAWLDQRFAEGLKLHIACENGHSGGLIEYIPGEYAWRVVQAEDYLVIHCLWVVGSNKQKGHGTRLLNACIEEARQTGKSGVAVVTTSRTWLPGKALFLKNGFEMVGMAPPSFELLALRFRDAPLPSFPDDWEQRLSRFGAGLTIIHSGQCPYHANAVQAALEAARELGIPSRTVELESSRQAREISPSAYGVYGVVYNGRLVTYHSAGKKALVELLEQTSHEAK